MKKLALFATLGVATFAASAQFGTAPDFNVTSTATRTSCTQTSWTRFDCRGGCFCHVVFSLLELAWLRTLQDLHEAYGPDGTNQLRVIFYEADATTTLADVQGTGSATLGDWTDGVTHRSSTRAR